MLYSFEVCRHRALLLFSQVLQLIWQSVDARDTSTNHTGQSIHNIQKPLACAAKRLLMNFQGTARAARSPRPTAILSSWCLCSHLKAAPAVRLHVPHSADGLDLGLVGSPVIPGLVGTHLQHVLVATVARVLVAHPAVCRGDRRRAAQTRVSFWKKDLRSTGQTRVSGCRKDLRSTSNLDAGNAILEAVGPQAGDVLIAHLHLTALEVWAFKQANLVVLRVLED